MVLEGYNNERAGQKRYPGHSAMIQEKLRKALQSYAAKSDASPQLLALAGIGGLVYAAFGGSNTFYGVYHDILTRVLNEIWSNRNPDNMVATELALESFLSYIPIVDIIEIAGQLPDGMITILEQSRRPLFE
jgi:hypothetical protein